MSQSTEAQMGQAGTQEAQAETVAAPRATRWGERIDPQAAVQESIKYRRRAQEAERRAEALEAEVQDLREARAERVTALESELASARAESQAAQGRLDAIERDRRLEREFIKAGCTDLETALALAHERLAPSGPGAGGQGTGPEDPAAFVRGLFDEKPHLRTAAPSAQAVGAMPPRTSGAKTPAADGPRRAVERLAERARSGSPRDLLAYMRARRGV